ncbi:MAG: hypothetical protein KatS3mg131_3406 [Candidatus Tectimicrobiota bacterium]|nr:MAG: hypothetical protein KatS3mg131_3406 [Candidatus Tectomicrobia bacterium]
MPTLLEAPDVLAGREEAVVHTTLFDLLAALQEAGEADDDFIVAAVAYLLCRGYIRFDRAPQLAN